MMAAEGGNITLKRSHQQMGKEDGREGGGDVGEAPIDDDLMEADVFA